MRQRKNAFNSGHLHSGAVRHKKVPGQNRGHLQSVQTLSCGESSHPTDIDSHPTDLVGKSHWCRRPDATEMQPVIGGWLSEATM